MVSASFTYFDAIVIGVLGLSCMFAFFRGFVKEILSLGAWIGAGLITIYYFPGLAERLKPHFKNPTVAAGIATLGLYITALLIFSMINALILRFLKEGSDVGILDNTLGLLFGAFRGAFLISLVYLLLTMVMGKEEEYPPWLKNARTRPAAEYGALVLAHAAPDYLRELTPLNEKLNGEGGASASPIRLPLFGGGDEAAAEKDVPLTAPPQGYSEESEQKLREMIDTSETEKRP